MTHTRLTTVCFDKLLERKSKATITLNELYQLHHQSRTDKERDLCFSPNILDRLRIKNFNEVVRLSMDHGPDQFLCKILNSLKGKIILEGENEKFAQEFCERFLQLLGIIDGDVFLAFLNVKSFGKRHALYCEKILEIKIERGHKVYFINFCKEIKLKQSFAMDIMNCREWLQSYTVDFTIDSCVYDEDINGNVGFGRHYLELGKRDSSANTKMLFDLFNEKNCLTETKQYLGRFLPLLEASELSGLGRTVQCDNCVSRVSVVPSRISIEIFEPDWSNCVGCTLKY